MFLHGYSLLTLNSVSLGCHDSMDDRLLSRELWIRIVLIELLSSCQNPANNTKLSGRGLAGYNY